MLELASSNDFFLEATGSGLPLFGLFDFGLEGTLELFAFELPLLLLLELLVEFELALPVCRVLLVLVLEYFVEA